jgi:hypothetical protein
MSDEDGVFEYPAECFLFTQTYRLSKFRLGYIVFSKPARGLAWVLLRGYSAPQSISYHPILATTTASDSVASDHMS